MITVNGKKSEYRQMSVAALLQNEGYRMDRVAVEINEEIVPKKSYPLVEVKDEDIIEVISFVGGG